MNSHYWDVCIRVEVTDGKATRAEIEDALTTELDQDIETDSGAVLNLTVTTATCGKKAP